MSDIGAVSLRLALLLAAAGLGASVYAGLQRREDWTRVAARSVGVVFALVTAAIAALFVCFARHDYQIAYVAEHSARSMPLQYRLAALWGGQAGSLLLWLWMLSAYSAAAVWFHRARAAARALGVRGAARERDLLPGPARRDQRSVREAPARTRRVRRCGPEPAAPAPGDDDPPADALHGAHRVRGAVRVRVRGARDG